MELVVPHNIVYTNKRDVPIEDIARSLIAVAYTAEHLPKILQNLFDGLIVEDVTVSLVSLRRDSIIEDYFYKLTIRQIEKLLEKAADKTGWEVLERRKELVAYLILALLLLGGAYALGRLFPEKQAININGNNNIVLSAAGDIIGMSPADLKKTIEESLNNKEKQAIARNAVDFFAAAKKEVGAEVKASDIVITRAAIDEVPNKELYDDLDDTGRTKEYEKTEVEFRQINLDSSETGWRCVVPAAGDRRIPLRVIPGISLVPHWQAGKIVGDVVIVFKRDSKGQERPAEAILYKIYD